MGGFWQGTNNDPTFVPLDEFVANKMLSDFEQDRESLGELVLEEPL